MTDPYLSALNLLLTGQSSSAEVITDPPLTEQQRADRHLFVKRLLAAGWVGDNFVAELDFTPELEFRRGVVGRKGDILEATYYADEDRIHFSAWRKVGKAEEDQVGYLNLVIAPDGKLPELLDLLTNLQATISRDTAAAALAQIRAICPRTWKYMEWYGCADPRTHPMNRLHCDNLRRNPRETLIGWLTANWMDNTDDEAAAMWLRNVEQTPWYAESVLYCLEQIVADPPADLPELLAEHGWISTEHDDGMGYTVAECADWLREALTECAAVYAAERPEAVDASTSPTPASSTPRGPADRG